MKLLNRIYKFNHKLLYRTVMTALVLSIISVAMPRTGSAASQATLTWVAPTTYTDGTPLTTLSGYKLYTSTTPGSFTQSIDVGNVNSYTLSNLNDATTYYFAVSAYDANGDVSGLSNQPSFTTPTPPPPASLYTLSAAAGSGGSITPSGSVVVSQGISQTFTITPSTGYKIAGVTVDGASVGAVSTYTFSNIAANHTISASFTANIVSYAISASAGIGGSISPAGTTTVNSGTSQTFTVTPNAGYKIAGVTVDGVSVGAVSSYTFSNVTANHTIATSFAVVSYSISSSAGTGGTISPAGTASINYGASQTFTVAPSAGYKIADVTIDGVSVGAVSTYIFSNITANHTISASFTANLVSYAISASAGIGGSISPAGTATVNSGTSQTFTITPSAGYKIAGVTVDGASVGAVSSYTFSNITANHTIAASFITSISKVVFADNAGGAKYTDSTGVNYLADTKYTGGTAGSTTAVISGTVNDAIYQTERYGNFSYSVPVANGNYYVTLKFAEIYFTAAGKRVFSVKINGQTVISNLDLYAKVGKNVAYDVVIPVAVTNGVLNIQFVSQVNNAKVSGILVSAM